MTIHVCDQFDWTESYYFEGTKYQQKVEHKLVKGNKINKNSQRTTKVFLKQDSLKRAGQSAKAKNGNQFTIFSKNAKKTKGSDGFHFDFMPLHNISPRKTTWGILCS